MIMNNVAVVTPMYNRMKEDGEKGLRKTIQHLEDLAQQGYNVYLAEDGSEDGSREELIKYKIKNPNSKINIILYPENRQKVGAIEETVRNLPKEIEYVLLTDDDTRVLNPEGIEEVIEMLEAEGHAGAALKVVPAVVNKADFNNCETLKNKAKYHWAQGLRILQDMDYSQGRVWYGYTTSEKAGVKPEDSKVRCIAGAGGIWNRNVLEEAFRYHSRRHNGDDMELTALVLKIDNGAHSVTYTDKVVFETETPKTYRDLLKQRIRWELGALETYTKEGKFYLNQIKDWVLGLYTNTQEEFGKHRLASTTLYEWGVWAAVPIAGALTYDAIKTGNYEYLENFAIFDTIYNSALLGLAAKKKEIRSVKQAVLALPALMAYRVGVTFPGKVGAVGSGVKNWAKSLSKNTSRDSRPTGGVATAFSRVFKK